MKGERGAVLIIALIFLLLITAIAAALVSSGSFQTVMTGNAQKREMTFRTAESAAEQTAQNSAASDRALNALNTALNVPAGELRALPGDAGMSYEAKILAVKASRSGLVKGYSTNVFTYKTFEIRGSAKTSDNRVQTDVVLGALIPKPNMDNGDG